jgi:hypothetical protein
MSDVTAINAALMKSRQFGYIRKLDSDSGLSGRNWKFNPVGVMLQELA